MDNNTFEVYLLMWFEGHMGGHNSVVLDNAPCYTDRERAEAHLERCNNARRLIHKLIGAKWFIRTLTVKYGPEEVKEHG